MNHDRLILGEGAVYSTDSAATMLNNNVLVVGGSGSGKTMSVLEPRLLETHNDSLVVSVSKNKLVGKYRKMFEKRGYAVKCVNFSSLSDSTDFFDPLSYIRTYADIKYLAEGIVCMQEKSPNSVADPFWDSISTSLLSAEIAFCLAKMDRPTFADVLDFHDTLRIEENGYMIKTSLDEAFDSLPRDHFAFKCWSSFRSLPIRSAGSAYASLNVLLDTLFTPELRSVMRTRRSVDITHLARNRTVLFIITSPVSRSMTGLSNLLIGQAIKELFEYAEELPAGRLPIPVQLLCDDFACAKIAHFDEYISIFREKGISAMLLVQSESQLASMYKTEGATTIINNCDTYVYAGGQDLTSAHHISERANMPLEDILYMPIGTEWIFRRGQLPLRTERYRITENALYRKVTAEHDKLTARTETSAAPRRRTAADFRLGTERKSEKSGIEKALEKKFDELFGNLVG